MTELRVCEFSGTARSGKGTIVEGIANKHPEVTTDETGADYRAVTFGLIADNVITLEMAPEQIKQIIKSRSEEQLASYSAKRKEIEHEHGKAVLYGNDVASLVHHVSPLEVVRNGVKKGFAKRVEQVRDSGDFHTLLVDGRQLDKVIETIDGTRMMLRAFVYCEPYEAARRDCLRRDIDQDSSNWDEEYFKSYTAIYNRNSADKNRRLDPVRPERNSIDYWKNQSLLDKTINLYAEHLFDGNKAKAISVLLIDQHDTTTIRREGAGLKAAREERQVYLDTTPFRHYQRPIEEMLSAVDRMFDEAITADDILSKQN